MPSEAISMTRSRRLAGGAGPAAASLVGHMPSDSLPKILLAVFLFVFGSACFDDCTPYRPLHFEAGEISSAIDPSSEHLGAVKIALDVERERWVAAAARLEDGKILYVENRAGELYRELLTEEAKPGLAALSRLPSQEAVLALIGSSAPEKAPPISALADSPGAKVEGEGVLLVLLQRSPGLWRRRAVAARALSPAMVVGEDAAIHLAFLQPAGDGSFAVVYVRLAGSSIQREEVGRGAYLMPPHIELVNGRPLVTYASRADEPVIVQALAGDGGAFEKRLELPAAILGAPEAEPTAISWRGDERGGWLALGSLVTKQRFPLPDGRRIRLDERAKMVFSLSRIESGKPDEPRVLGTTSWEERFTIHVLDEDIDMSALMPLTSAMGASALLLPSSEPARMKAKGRGKRAHYTASPQKEPAVLLVGPL